MLITNWQLQSLQERKRNEKYIYIDIAMNYSFIEIDHQDPWKERNWGQDFRKSWEKTNRSLVTVSLWVQTNLRSLFRPIVIVYCIVSNVFNIFILWSSKFCLWGFEYCWIPKNQFWSRVEFGHHLNKCLLNLSCTWGFMSYKILQPR